MNTDKFELTYEFPVSSGRLYRAWLSSDEHSAFTGGEASIENIEGSTFTAWDGYIDGKILELEPAKRILQTWRTTDFPLKAEHSFLELLFEDTESGCKLTLYQWNIPEGQGKEYEEGWVEHYFTPMTEYFENYGKHIE
jgi:activator of HSP90 ATPase